MKPTAVTVKTDGYTIASGSLDVGNGHQIYYEQWGNPRVTTPILYFHGGPGSSYQWKYKLNFDPKRHQVLFFDQRGCGNSMPYGKLANNTSQDIIGDAIKILDHFHVKKVYVHGGSWGSALALYFSINHAERTAKTVITGVFTGSKDEIEYLDRGLFRRFYPEVWDRFVASVPANHKNNPAAYHYQRVLGEVDNEPSITASSKALHELESPLLQFDWPGYQSNMRIDLDHQSQDTTYDYVPYRIYAHYLSHACFFDDNYILSNVHKIQTPLFIVQGRYDMICPPATAYAIHQLSTNSKLYMTLGSHGYDPENRTALHVLIDSELT